MIGLLRTSGKNQKLSWRSAITWSTLFDTVERAVREVSDEEQKLVFDVLVELRHTLKLKDSAQRREALRLLHDTAPAVLHWPEKNRSGAVAQE